MEKTTRVFLSGPMSGYENFNYSAFNEAAAKIRAAGYHVENPAENKECATWGAYMVLAVAQLVTCDTVVQLHGWEQSRGARREYDLAKDFEMQIISLADFEKFYLAGKPEKPAQPSMPEWRCHKRVRAAKITSVPPIPSFEYYLTIEANDPREMWPFNLVTVDQAWMTTNMPEVGGYYVELEEGGTGYIPAKEFEAIYSRVYEPDFGKVGSPVSEELEELRALCGGTQWTEAEIKAMQAGKAPNLQEMNWTPAFKAMMKEVGYKGLAGGEEEVFPGVHIDAVHLKKPSDYDQYQKGEGEAS